MGKHGTLYQHLADAIRAHSGDPAELIAAVCDLVSDEVAAEVGDRLDEELHQIDAAIGASERPVPAPEGRRGHTESEAAQRWCPFAREVTPIGKSKRDAAVGNRYFTERDDFANPGGCRCIAFDCMAWRWSSADRGHCGIAGPVEFMPAGEPRQLRNRIPPAREPADLFDASAAGCRDDGINVTT